MLIAISLSSLPFAPMGRPDLRASDADREEVVGQLRRHAEAGRLTVDELDERCSQALSAVTLGELGALTRDLPREPAPASRHPTRPPPRMPGKHHFADTWRAPTTAEHAMGALMEHVAPPLARHGYRLVERTPHRLAFVRERRPVWTILVAVFLFPIGLFALLYKDREQITIDLHPEGRSTLVSAAGIAPLDVRRAFATLEA
jgi:hypothetical protein